MIRMMTMAAALAASCAAAAECPPPGLSHGMSFKEAREAVLVAGWEPVPQDDQQIGVGPNSTHWAKAFPEGQVCAFTHLGQCVFVYRQDEDGMAIITEGEPNVVIDGWPDHGVRLAGWRCGEPLR